MGSLFLRKSSSSPAPKRFALAALSHLLHSSSSATEKLVSVNVPQFHELTPIPKPSTIGKSSSGALSLRQIIRGFHASRPLAAGYAVADLPDDDEGLEIAKLGISQEIVSALAQKGITKLFPIQRAVLEPAMQGSGMIGRARTGTGKTLAFGIPIMDKIIRYNEKHGRGRNPLALILAPTRELAKQVDKEFYESAPNLDTLCVYSGVPIGRQMGQLERGVDVVVGTPGRIIDLIRRGALNLAEIQFVVLDEADQMLNVGFAEDVETILENVPRKRQTMMFSATMPNWIMKLTQKFLRNPVRIDIVGDSDQKLADGISLYSIACEMHSKPAILGPLITEHAKGGKCIVFTQTKRDADRLAYAMQRSHRCEALHGDISQNQRERTLSGFRQGHFNILVATDVAARGLDVPNVDLDNYYAGNTGGYQQHTSGTNYLNAGNPKWNSNELQQNSTMEPQVPRDEGDGSIKGTTEELDHFCKEGKIGEAVKVLGLLEQQHVAVDLPRYLSLMMLCAENKVLEEAKSVHKHLMRSGIHLEVKTYNKILEMYGKCGSMDDAFAVFNQMQKRNLTSWDHMITWFGRNGQGEDAIELFSQFKELGWKPDAKIFLGVFSACGEVGDIIEGMLHFESMSKDYGIVPSLEHYASAVNMMGSVGYLDEALEFIERMPIEPNVDVWKTMMNFCRIHGNTELGDRCTDIVEILEPSCLNEQSRAGLIPVIASDLVKEKKIQKSASQSLLEARSRVHEYRAGDRSCPDHEKLYALLGGLKQQMKEAGYIPEVKFVLHDIDLEGKEEAILAHSEKLAVARGLIDSPARSSIRIIKNLRICGDCHSAMKIISKLVGRELIIRDAKRFHHFRDGLCSCRDYW